MARAKGPHLIKPGAKRWVAGAEVQTTWCGTWAERDDYGESGIGHVKCATCIARHNAVKVKG